MTVVLDASALLAVLKGEPGSYVVREQLAESIISTVNWAEVVQKMLARDVNVTELHRVMEGTGLTIEPFDVEGAEQAARLWQVGSGLSLADRACLALGLRLNAPVLTADRYWATLETGAQVRVIR